MNATEEQTDKSTTRDEIAKLALAMHDHEYFFVLKRGLSFRFSRDLNGSGTQGLSITRKSDEQNPKGVMFIVFEYSYKKDVDFLYEADLIVDRGKDYEPTVNRGKHPFVAQSAAIEIDWEGSEISQWQSDVQRLKQSHKTLSEWIMADLNMLIRCSDIYCYRKSAILYKDDLIRHADAGTSLDELRSRLKCSECGKRNAILLPL